MRHVPSGHPGLRSLVVRPSPPSAASAAYKTGLARLPGSCERYFVRFFAFATPWRGTLPQAILAFGRSFSGRLRLWPRRPTNRTRKTPPAPGEWHSSILPSPHCLRRPWLRRPSKRPHGVAKELHLRRFTYGASPTALHLRRFTYGASPTALHLRRFTYGASPTALHLGVQKTCCPRGGWGCHTRWRPCQRKSRKPRRAVCGPPMGPGSPANLRLSTVEVTSCVSSIGEQIYAKRWMRLPPKLLVKGRGVRCRSEETSAR